MQVALLTTILPGVAMTDEGIGLINRSLPKELILRFSSDPSSDPWLFKEERGFHRIFSYVDIVGKCRAASVCRLWHQLALDGSLWQSVDFFAFQVRPLVLGSFPRGSTWDWY